MENVAPILKLIPGMCFHFMKLLDGADICRKWKRAAVQESRRICRNPKKGTTQMVLAMPTRTIS